MQDKNLFLGFLKSLQPPAFSAEAFQAAQIPQAKTGELCLHLPFLCSVTRCPG